MYTVSTGLLTHRGVRMQPTMCADPDRQLVRAHKVQMSWLCRSGCMHCTSQMNALSELHQFEDLGGNISCSPISCHNFPPFPCSPLHPFVMLMFPLPSCCTLPLLQVHIPEGLTGQELDTIKLTAQFVARNGKNFLTGLSSREHTNPAFNFLKPTHSLFGFFTSLCDAYSRCLMPPKGTRDRLSKDSTDRQALELALLGMGSFGGRNGRGDTTSPALPSVGVVYRHTTFTNAG